MPMGTMTTAAIKVPERGRLPAMRVARFLAEYDVQRPTQTGAQREDDAGGVQRLGIVAQRQ